MIKVLIHTQAKTLTDKVIAVTKKCMELKDLYPNFCWEFHNYHGTMTFTAAHWSGREGEKFEFPIHMVDFEEKYEYIRHALEELKWTAVLYQEEED